MSLGMATGRFTEGYLKQERVEGEQDVREAQAQGTAEDRKLRMDKFRSDMKKENFTEAARRMLVGDFDGAIEHFNQSGDKKIAPGSIQVQQDDEGNAVFSWQDGNTGEDVTMDSRFMMLTAGIKPTDLETPKQKHGRAMELAQVKASGAGTDPADVKSYNHIINNLKNPKTGKKYTPEEAWREAKRSPESRLKIASQMASSYMRANPGVSAEETQEHVDKMMSGLESKYSTASGAMAGPGGAMSPAPAGGSAAGFMPTQQQIADKQKQSDLLEKREDDIIDPYDFE